MEYFMMAIWTLFLNCQSFSDTTNITFDDILLNIEWLPQGNERLMLMGWEDIGPLSLTSVNRYWSTTSRNISCGQVQLQQE